MKKKIVIMIVLLLAVVGAMAQNGEEQVGRFSIIPRVGVAIANLTDNSMMVSSEQTSELKSKSQAGFLGGVDVEYRAAENFAVSLGAYYARQGYRYADYEEMTENAGVKSYSGMKNQHANIDYLQVPLMLKAYVTPGFAVMAGAQMGFLLGDAKFLSESTALEKDKNGSTTYKETTSKEEVMPLRKVDVSIPLGLSYEYMNVILDARYNIGLTNVYKGDKLKSKNKVLTFTVGYRFTL